jgi:hypothetical protein
MKTIPSQLREYHASGKPLCCDIPVQPWTCEFWPIDGVLNYNEEYEVDTYAPGYFGFATSGGGEMFALSPVSAVVCLAFIGMSPDEELAVAPSWSAFEDTLTNAL